MEPIRTQELQTVVAVAPAGALMDVRLESGRRVGVAVPGGVQPGERTSPWRRRRLHAITPQM